MIKNKILKKTNFFLLKQLLLINQNKKILGKNKIIFKKNNFIISKLNKLNYFLYKGNKFRTININNFFFGYRFGVFCLTRKPFKYIIKTKQNSKLLKR